ncbi:MAG: hypothetical protein R2789_11495 [Microthrixaceae bacterium]
MIEQQVLGVAPVLRQRFCTDDLHDLGGDGVWRTWLIFRVSVVMSSSALSVADFMARWREACSEAAESSIAANSRAST